MVVCQKATVNESGFDSELFFKHLNTRYIGKLLMCAHTVTSTQTILMEYPIDALFFLHKYLFDYYNSLHDHEGLSRTCIHSYHPS